MDVTGDGEGLVDVTDGAGDVGAFGRRAALIPELEAVSRLQVRQHVERFEALTGWETCNSYSVYDAGGAAGAQAAPMYHVAEESSVCCRQCCRNRRSFVLHVMRGGPGPRGAVPSVPVLRLERPWTFRPLTDSVEVYSPAGARPAPPRGDAAAAACEDWFLGRVVWRWALFSRRFDVRDDGDNTLFHVRGGIFSPWTFNIQDPRTGEVIGAVRKQWSGFVKEMFTDADNFGIEMPRGLRSSEKALLLGAVFLIDFLYFEDNDPNSQRHRGQHAGGSGAVGRAIFGGAGPL